MKLKLTIELIPSTCWYKNLRQKVGSDMWDAIRRQCYEKVENRCQLCKSSNRIHCHELWEYNDLNLVQTLRGFQVLCHDCHMIKHIGYANIQASKGLLHMEKLIHHFLTVNQVERSLFDEHYRASAVQWKKRSKYQWGMDLGKWQKLVK